jgi:hypothetical protein
MPSVGMLCSARQGNYHSGHNADSTNARHAFAEWIEIAVAFPSGANWS